MSIYNDYHVLLQLFDQHGYALVSYLLGFFSYRESLIPGLLPCVGMEFRNSDEAWAFWLSYGGQKSFEVRKGIQTKQKAIRRQGYIMQICLCKWVPSARQNGLFDEVPLSWNKNQLSSPYESYNGPKERSYESFWTDFGTQPHTSSTRNLTLNGFSKENFRSTGFWNWNRRWCRNWAKSCAFNF